MIDRHEAWSEVLENIQEVSQDRFNNLSEPLLSASRVRVSAFPHLIFFHPRSIDLKHTMFSKSIAFFVALTVLAPRKYHNKYV